MGNRGASSGNGMLIGNAHYKAAFPGQKVVYPYKISHIQLGRFSTGVRILGNLPE
jgi:hypothetical protein